jgi:aminoglycoside 3-N-acetyltransferase
VASIVVPRGKIISQLKDAFSGIKDDIIVFHTDLMQVGIIDQIKPREQLLSDYWSVIQEVAGGRCLLFPTFNYGFCRDGLYDVLNDPSEVGVLNEYVRQLNPNLRTRTPVFNYCILNNKDFSLSAVDNPFSVGSTFGKMVEYNARIVFFGARLDGNTFIHHVEEVVNIGYRYIKPFPGKIVMPDGSRERITLQYRVRPLDGGVVYDWERLENELECDGILQKQPLGNGHLMHFRADHLLDHWAEKLQKEELYLLTPASQQHMNRLFEEHGYPLSYASVEGTDPSSLKIKPE